MMQTLTPDQIAGHAGTRPARGLRLPGNQLFARRAQRLRQLATGHMLADFLSCCATLADAQHQLDLATAGHPAPRLAELIQVLLTACGSALSPAMHDAVYALLQEDDATLQALANQLAAGEVPAHPALLAGLPVLGAALQVQRTAMVRHQPMPAPSEGTLVCPCCGGQAVTSMLRRGDSGLAERWVSCSLCGSEWPASRITCLHCGNSKQLHYRSLMPHEAEPPHPDKKQPHAHRQAQELECCDACQGAMKQISALQDPSAEAIADDLASLALDLLAAEQGYHRLGFNPLLLTPAD